jgi:hypothetical protein
MYPVRMMLPVLNKYGSKACFESPGYSDLPRRLDPLSVVDEKNIFEMMAEQLNDVFMTNLAVEIDVSRDSAEADNALETALAGKRIVVVGASHGTRIASALEELGIEIIDISVPGWKVTSEAVEAMLSELSSVLSENYSGDTIVIYQLYDNNTFLACDADGNRSLPVKMGDNNYHLLGRLAFIDREEFKEIFLKTLPLLRGGLNYTKVLLTPLMRYVTSPCCSDIRHLTNRREKGLAKRMGEAIGEIRGWIQDFAFTRRIRNFITVCPNTLLQSDSDVEDGADKIRGFWTSGPVHMNGDGYKCLATNLLDHILEGKVSRPTEAKTSARKNIPDRAAAREDWVNKDDTSVHRRYDDGGRVNWRGGRGGHQCGGSSWRGRGRAFAKSHFKRPKPY